MGFGLRLGLGLTCVPSRRSRSKDRALAASSVAAAVAAAALASAALTSTLASPFASSNLALAALAAGDAPSPKLYLGL